MQEQLYSIITQWGIFILIILLTIFLAYLVNRFFIRLIKRSSEEMKNDPTNYLFLRHTSVGLIYMVGIASAIYSVPNLRAVANSMLAGAGILAVAVGFASQHALGNVISGFFIVLFKPFRVNDRLLVRDKAGIVEDITLRHTVIRDFENKRIIIPNTVISNEIIVNSDFAEDKICRWIDVGISYESDIDLAKNILVDEIKNHPLRMDVRTEMQIEAGDPEVVVRVLSLGSHSVNLRAWAWAKDAPDSFVMSCDLYESIKKRFDKEGIEIPYPYQNVIIKS